jgi:hypothetical protein
LLHPPWSAGLRGHRSPRCHRCLPHLDIARPPRPETAAVDGLRRVLAGLDAQQAFELLLDKIRDTSSNAEFLRQVLAHPRVA